MNEKLKLPPDLYIKAFLCLIAMSLLFAAYVFQGFSIFSLFPNTAFHPNVVFTLNRTLRLIVNDFACFILIYVLFKEPKYLKLAFWVFLIELFIILPMYLMFKLSLEGDSEISSPILSQIHRLIVNPMLMILLMVGFLYQRTLKK